MKELLTLIIFCLVLTHLPAQQLSKSSVTGNAEQMQIRIFPTQLYGRITVPRSDKTAGLPIDVSRTITRSDKESNVL